MDDNTMWLKTAIIVYGLALISTFVLESLCKESRSIRTVHENFRYEMVDERVEIIYVNDRSAHVDQFVDTMIGRGIVSNIIKVPAVTPDSVNFRELVMNGTLDSTFVKTASPGVVCCALSHLGAARRLLESTDDRVLLFEDDVAPADDLDLVANGVKQAYKFLAEYHGSVDLLYLGYCFGTCTSEMQAHDVFKFDGTGHLPGCTHAYIMTRSAAERLIRNLPLRHPSDGAYDHTPGFVGFGLKRPIFYQKRSKLGSKLNNTETYGPFCNDRPELGSAFI